MTTTHDDLLRRIEQSDRASADAREKIAGALSRIETTQAQHGETLGKIDARVTTLEASDHRREGRDGVFAALMRSPVMAWLAAAVAVVWAAIGKTADAG